MTKLAPSFSLPAILAPEFLEDCFPNWKSVEIFGAPGAGKSFLCRRLIASSEKLLTTTDDAALRFFLDRRMSAFVRLLFKVLGNRLMKNYYKFQADCLSRRDLERGPEGIRRYLQAVESALEKADLPERSHKNVRKSVRSSGLALALSEELGRQLLVDEGLVRKLITMLVQSQVPQQRLYLLDSLRECLTLYPWEKNAIFVDAPEARCISRQEQRGHVIHGPGRFQVDQLAAAREVSALCLETGWNMIRFSNDTDVPSSPGEGLDS